MDRFTRYEPGRHGKESLTGHPGFRIRHARPDDLEALARLSWQRNGGELDQELDNMRRAISRSMSSDQRLLLVAVLDRVRVAYGKARVHTPPSGAPENAAPAGWYLSGLVVAEPYQRRGVGEALTRSRLAWLAPRCREVFYLVNARNRASIDLHTRLGFREVTRDFDYPRVTFEGGEGILFRVSLPRSGTAVEETARALENDAPSPSGDRSDDRAKPSARCGNAPASRSARRGNANASRSARRGNAIASRSVRCADDRSSPGRHRRPASSACARTRSNLGSPRDGTLMAFRWHLDHINF